jgi:hypothetical protein
MAIKRSSSVTLTRTVCFQATVFEGMVLDSPGFAIVPGDRYENSLVLRRFRSRQQLIF